MIYVDPIFEWPEDCYRSEEARRVGERHGHRWSHFFADPDDASMVELHRVARLIGMRRAWFQPDKDGGHYDLVPSRRRHAVRLGAKEVTEEEAVAIWKRSRAARKAQLVAPPLKMQMVLSQSLRPVSMAPSFLAEHCAGYPTILLRRPHEPTPCVRCGASLNPQDFVVRF